jgi:formylglycine-generating enzyme required for sulfatase activity
MPMMTYDEAFSQIPLQERSEISRSLGKQSSLPLFQAQADLKGAGELLKKSAKAESFQFRSFEIPAGGKKILIGSPETELGRNNNEKLREVLLPESFEMQATPVTQLQWALVMGKNPSTFKYGEEMVNGIAINPNRPVEKVTWKNAQEYVQKLNQLDSQYTYRLPTEAEWEYAVRGGTKTAYFFGDDPALISEYAWHKGNSGDQSHNVASLKPNPAGLYDTLGNVSELMHDTFYDNRLTQVIYRGGSWILGVKDQRSAARGAHEVTDTSSRFGFRVIRIPKNK